MKQSSVCDILYSSGNTQAFRELKPSTLATHPCNSPMQLTHATHPCNSPMQLTHATHPCNSPMQLTHATHPCNSPMQLPHATHPCNSPMQLTRAEDNLHFRSVSRPPFQEGDWFEYSCGASFYITDPYNVTRVVLSVSRSGQTLRAKMMSTVPSSLNSMLVSSRASITNSTLLRFNGGCRYTINYC